MLLTKDEIQTITLNAKFVHKYADQVYFVEEVNQAPQRLGDQPFLNFFVRYHHRDAPERYTWSRVRRVVLLEDAIAAAQHGHDVPPVLSATLEWRGKTFWVCLAVEPVQAVGAGASSASVPHESTQLSSLPAGTEEEELVALSQLSNTVPTDDEVLAFCVTSANRRPQERYVDGVLGDVAAVPPVLPDAIGSLLKKEPEEAEEGVGDHVGIAPSATDAALNPRLFVPTARQVDLLRQYKKQHFTHHQWSEEEIEASKALRQRYSAIGVAAAPVRTVAFLQEHRAVERKQQQHQYRPKSSAEVEAVFEFTPDPLSQQPTDGEEAADRLAVSQTQRSTPVAIPVASIFSLNDTPVSPFLPRSVLRQRLPHGGPASAVDRPLSATLPGGTTSLSTFSPLDASQTPPSPGQPEAPLSSSQGSVSQEPMSQHLSQLRAAEESFFKYISDGQRSHYLNRLASITRRNSETNAQSRRRGIANERRLERKGNLLESRGLWITDDKARAKEAEDYVKIQGGDSSSAKKNEEKAVAASAAAGGGANDSADNAKSAEEVFVEKFKAYHDAQHISFADCADDLLSEKSDDVEALVRHVAAEEADGADIDVPKGNETSADALRVGRRAVRRLLPNRLNTEEATPTSVQAQLVHRSTVRMAKRPRGE